MSRREALEQALARALDSGGGRALASAIPARAELAIVVDHDAVELADALEPLLRALERQGIARTHLELVLACDAGGAPVPRERCDALRARHPGVRVHAKKHARSSEKRNNLFCVQ